MGSVHWHHSKRRSTQTGSPRALLPDAQGRCSLGWTGSKAGVGTCSPSAHLARIPCAWLAGKEPGAIATAQRGGAAWPWTPHGC